MYTSSITIIFYHTTNGPLLFPVVLCKKKYSEDYKAVGTAVAEKASQVLRSAYFAQTGF
jgi:hypothetical protein